MDDGVVHIAGTIRQQQLIPGSWHVNKK